MGADAVSQRTDDVLVLNPSELAGPVTMGAPATSRDVAEMSTPFAVDGPRTPPCFANVPSGGGTESGRLSTRLSGALHTMKRAMSGAGLVSGALSAGTAVGASGVLHTLKDWHKGNAHLTPDCLEVVGRLGEGAYATVDKAWCAGGRGRGQGVGLAGVRAPRVLCSPARGSR